MCLRQIIQRFFCCFFFNTQNEFSCDCNESETTVLILSTWLSALALPQSWLRKVTLKLVDFHLGSCGQAVFCPKTQHMSLIFYLPCFTSDWNIYFPHFNIMFHSCYWFYCTHRDVYDTGYTAPQKVINYPYHEFVAMFVMPFVSHFLFSFYLVPIKTTWEQEMMGNSFGAIVLWKKTTTWCLYLVPF